MNSMLVNENPRYNITVGKTPTKFVWFRVAKTGTQSTMAILRENVREFEIEKGYRVKYTPKRYSDYFKFSFVRNPFARIVSAWNDKIIRGMTGGGKFCSEDLNRFRKFEFFLDWLKDQDPTTVNIHYRPQTLLIPEEIDFIGRLENVEIDMRHVLGNLGIETECEVPHRNRSNSPGLEKVASKSAMDAIRRYYELDFARFSYDPR